MIAKQLRSAFTLMEILIVVAIIAVIGTIVMLLINPWRQIDKAKDAKRKQDLHVMQTAFEDYYNDKGCYPTVEHVCYDAGANVCAVSKTVTSKLCHICGTEPTPPLYSELKKYLPQIPCDPDHPSKDYLYEVQRPGCTRNNGAGNCVEVCSSNTYCPQWYRTYSDFADSANPDAAALGCENGGCGPTGTPFGFDYGVSSNQVGIERSTSYNCVAANVCNACQLPGNYEACMADSGCPEKNRVYATRDQCCASSPKPQGCP